jgi:lysophospholipid acyltransferase (LPLAT)-like uncharacterized protein
VKYNDESVRQYYEKGESVIFAFWHRRLFYLSYYHSHRFPDRKAYVLVSQSRDGTRIGKIGEKIGVDYIQGSTSKGGAKAFKHLVEIIKKGNTAAITPDGPRGPRGIVQKGVISLARLTGRPIIPLSYHPKRYIELKSWDKFIIPVPFSKVAIHTGKPIVINKNHDKDDSFYENMIKEELDKLENQNSYQ